MGLLPDYKELIVLAKKYGTLEAQEQIMSLREELVSLREENLSLRERLKASENISFESPYYWLVEGETRDGPFCQVCQDNEKKLVRLQSRSKQRGAWDCKVCQNFFTDKNYVEWTQSRSSGGGSWMGV